MGGAYCNLPCTVAMEEGHQHEILQCTEEKGNHKTTAIFGVDESNIRLWWKHKTAIS
jgi:hypothetical protein